MNRFNKKLGSIIKPIHQCGNGPWFVFMIINIAQKSLKKTEIKIHTYPNLVEYIQNSLRSTKKQIWRVVISIGPFDDWIFALIFYYMWENGKRGCKSRMMEGINLFKKYKHIFNLDIYITPYTKSETKKIYESNTSKERVFKLPTDCFDEDNSQQEQEEEEEDEETSKKKKKRKQDTNERDYDLKYIINAKECITRVKLNQQDIDNRIKWTSFRKAQTSHSSPKDTQKESEPINDADSNGLYSLTLAWIFKDDSE